MDQKMYRSVEGVWLYNFFKDEAVRSAVNYKPHGKRRYCRDVFYSDYFEHLLPWYERRHESNVLFLTYEELKADAEREVLKIAAFLGEEHAAALREDRDVLWKVLNACSLENKKKFFDGAAIHRAKGMLEAALPGNTALVEVLKNLPSETVEMHERFAIIRKALIGEWRHYFTPEQMKQMEKWILKKTQGSPVKKFNMDQAMYRYVEGVWLYEQYRDEAVRSAINYKPQEGDIIVVSYPKCGTNWTVFTVYTILTRGREPSNAFEYYTMCPFIDMIGTGLAEEPSRKGPIFTHLPMKVFPPAEKAKYIYVARNPYDCAVSMYYFLKGKTRKTFPDVSFEAFLRLYLNGKVVYGDYFDHLLPWYERRHDSNVLFLTYEELKADTEGQVLKIADFLGKKHATALREDEDILWAVLNASSSENMKKFFERNPKGELWKFAKATRVNSAVADALKKFRRETVETHESTALVRKAIIGDWRNYFNPAQINQMKDWIARKTEGSDVMTLWNKCDLP
ncbi:hypothetical protein HPB50_014330 [Hyalomma asiaticum]|uniref:Uncharacterized protein n=1 Tax=Hyalomma asiaticum TaxID=266040 RepID=A0ACB7RTS2_HYAAI|nr:hypothetical protein HPB50_014330 [Hyalomma asiaticum]